MLVFGSGQVAQVIGQYFGEVRSQLTQGLDPATLVGHKDCDITDTSALRRIIKGHHGHWVVNAAGKTNVDWCEEPANRAECLAVNGQAPVTMGMICKELGKKLVHISTGCMFDGNRVHSTEESVPNPAVHYARCKALADHGLMTLCADSVVIIRPRMLISGLPVPSNYIYKVWQSKRYRAHSEPNSVTYVPDIAQFIGHTIREGLRGIYNVACHRPTTPYAIANRVQDANGMDLDEISYDDLLLTMRNKRVNAVLSTWKAEATGFTSTDVVNAIYQCIEELQHNVQGA